MTAVMGLAFCDLGYAPPTAALPPPFYSAKDIQATVVDRDTGRPLAGVVVVALWELRPVSGRGPRLHVAETTTDSQGHFVIAGWGPKPRPPLTALAHRSPLLVLFKSGFIPLELHNEARATVERVYPHYRTMRTRELRDGILWLKGSPNDPVQDCIWNGLTLELEPFRSTPRQWLLRLEGIRHRITRDDTPATRQLHHALLRERNYFRPHTRTATPGLARSRIDAFFSEIEDRLREVDR